MATYYRNKTIRERLEELKRSYYFQGACVGVTLIAGIAIGSKLKELKFDHILSNCEVFIWDCFEKDIKSEEFFKCLTPEMRVFAQVPTQVFIN